LSSGIAHNIIFCIYLIKSHDNILAPVVVLNGRSYIFPSDKVSSKTFCHLHVSLFHLRQATASEAAELCAKREMNLISLETKEETNRIAEHVKTQREYIKMMKMQRFILLKNRTDQLVDVTH
jgi:hypothetical protein